MIYSFLHILTFLVCLGCKTQHSICCSILFDRTYLPNSMNNLFILVFCIKSTQIDIDLLWLTLNNGRECIRNLLTYPLSISWFSICFYITNHAHRHIVFYLLHADWQRVIHTWVSKRNTLPGPLVEHGPFDTWHYISVQFEWQYNTLDSRQ